MKRILHIVGNMAPDGMSNFLMNIYRNIDRTRMQFDFIVMGEKPDNYHETIRQMGGKVYKVTRMSKNPWKYYSEIRDIIRENHYDIVFRQTDTATVAIDLLAAKRGGATVRIPHSHSTNAVHPFFHKMLRPLLVNLSTDRYACSKQAGEWMFGKASFQVVYNGIDLDRYSYHPEIRREKRQEWNVLDKLVFGHIGNFFYPKNHKFLLEIFAEIAKKREDAVLFLIGSGELQEEIEKQVTELGLQKKVIFTGTRNDIYDMVQMLDCLIFPSIYEGLPITLVEAQAAGVPCLISDVITDEIALTELIHKLSLQDEADKWADLAVRLATECRESEDRENRIEVLQNAGYALDDLAKRYERL
ncbi:MAG: glycosyltransferase family 1 protein [Lachnospiraceae bacterium]|nr:glycosyltransferase family 1 protein [Lachnospiraceae bacterium]